MKISVKQLRTLISENIQHLLSEAEKKAEKEQPEDSVDRQIDKYFSEYEKEAKSVKQEGLDFRVMSRNFFSLMLEAEDDEEAEDKDEESEEGEEEGGGEEPAKLTLEDIDLENFADSVVRLIENYDSLLEIRDTIAKRSMNFLSKNYEPNVANEFKEILETQHDVMIGTTEFDEDADDFPAPPAERAQGGGGGGGAA
jgi:hypothetical protein